MYDALYYNRQVILLQHVLTFWRSTCIRRVNNIVEKYYYECEQILEK